MAPLVDYEKPLDQPPGKGSKPDPKNFGEFGARWFSAKDLWSQGMSDTVRPRRRRVRALSCHAFAQPLKHLRISVMYRGLKCCRRKYDSSLRLVETNHDR